MAIQQYTTTLKLNDADWKALGRSPVVAGSVASTGGLVEGTDFEIDAARGLIRRLRVLATGLHTFTLNYDDRAEEFAAAATELAAARADLQDNYTAAINRLDQIRTQMAAIAVATFANNTARDTAIKQIAAGVDDEALILKRTLRYLRGA